MNAWTWGVWTLSGALCMKFVANTKIMTSCRIGSINANEVHLNLQVTVVDSRTSNIYPCLIFDATVKAFTFDAGVSNEVCKVVNIDGVLWCVEEDMVGGEEILTFFPVKDDDLTHSLAIQYTVCGTRMETFCSAPAALPSLEPNEAILSLSSTGGNHPIVG